MHDDAAEIALPERSVVRFLGDLHLGDGGRNDAFGAKDPLLVELLRDCESSCDAVVLMGDALDLHQAWSVPRIARAHPEVFRALDALARRVAVIFVRGNHDWNVDYGRVFPRARSCERLALGDALAWHGHQLDRLCRVDSAHYQTNTTLHHLAERALGFRFRVPLHEHDTWRNRAAHWLGCRYGRHLRRMAVLYRRLGLPGRAARCEEFISYWSRCVWGDPHDLFRPAAALARSGWRAVVCGHTHLAGVVDLGGCFYVNAGSWTFGAAQVAAWDGARFTVEDRAARAEVRDEAYRWMLDDPDPGDFFAWWEQHYRGWLRFARPRTRPTRS